MEELKPCPFCGGEPFYRECYDDCKQITRGIRCNRVNCCGFWIGTTYQTIKEAIKEWNRRSDNGN